MRQLYNNADSRQQTRSASNPHAVFVTRERWEEMNRPSWVVVLLVPGVIAALCWALPSDEGPRWSASPSQQAVSAADAATITNVRGR